jgi:AbiV family abortive infection protein
MPLQTGLDRTKLQRLADQYARDAQILFEAGAWSSAYYLAGYSIECALKACIADQIRAHIIPDREQVRDFYTHDLTKLLKLAELQGELLAQMARSSVFAKNWAAVSEGWSESSRYEQRNEVMARVLLSAISDTRDGVLQWIKLHWQKPI